MDRRFNRRRRPVTGRARLVGGDPDRVVPLWGASPCDRHRDAVLWKLEGLADDDDPDADLRVRPDETTEDVLAFYGRARAAADQVIDELDVEATGTAWFGDTVTLRWVLIHMVEETARHAGHVDIIRELIDGMTGDHRSRD